MANLQNQFKEKRAILREEYGGMMSLRDLIREMHLPAEKLKEWAAPAAVKPMEGARVRYDTDMIAKMIVLERGMC